MFPQLSAIYNILIPSHIPGTNCDIGLQNKNNPETEILKIINRFLQKVEKELYPINFLPLYRSKNENSVLKKSRCSTLQNFSLTI